MHNGRSVVDTPSRAVLKKHPGLRVCTFSILVLSFLGSHASAAPGARPADNQPAQAAGSQYVGSETCATCHEEVSKGFATNPHTKMALMHGKQGITCENCHGAGKAHVDGGGDASKILNPAKAAAKEVDKTCLTCHAGQHPNFLRSPHAKADVSCVSCHTVHANKGTEHLLKAEQPTLCFQCHADQRPAFGMPFHHKVNEGLVKCTDCHDAHGTFQRANLRTTADQNMICTKCHTDVRGPFVFEHAPVKAEGCMGCHTPHGSQNARLLNMPQVNLLCNQCHNPVSEGAIHGVGMGSQTSTSCVNCHTMVHGSNASQAFIR